MFNEWYAKEVKIKELKTRIVDGVGKLTLVYTCTSTSGVVSEITIPEIDLNTGLMEFASEKIYTYPNFNFYPPKNIGSIRFELKKDCYGNMFTYKELGREISKEDLEKELGYKLKIK